MSYCKICGDENNVSYYAGNRGNLCPSCAKNTPRKVGFAEFVAAYFKGQDMTDYGNHNTAKEFYDDYRASTHNLADYIKATTSAIM